MGVRLSYCVNDEVVKLILFPLSDPIQRRHLTEVTQGSYCTLVQESDDRGRSVEGRVMSRKVSGSAEGRIRPKPVADSGVSSRSVGVRFQVSGFRKNSEPET